MNEQKITIAVEFVLKNDTQYDFDFDNISIVVVQCMQGVEKLQNLNLTGEEKKEAVMRVFKHLAIERERWSPTMSIFIPLFIDTIILFDRNEMKINPKKAATCLHTVLCLK